MTKRTARMTTRSLKVAAGASMLTLAAGTPAGAASSVDETINVPGATPSGVVAVAGQQHEIPGAKDVSVRIQATSALADPVAVGTSGFSSCTLFDKSIQLDLDAGASGTVTVSYTEVDGDTGVETVTSQPYSFGPTPAASQELVKLCLR